MCAARHGGGRREQPSDLSASFAAADTPSGGPHRRGQRGTSVVGGGGAAALMLDQERGRSPGVGQASTGPASPFVARVLGNSGFFQHDSAGEQRERRGSFVRPEPTSHGSGEATYLFDAEPAPLPQAPPPFLAGLPAFDLRVPIMVIGPQNSGKTTFIQSIFERRGAHKRGKHTEQQQQQQQQKRGGHVFGQFAQQRARKAPPLVQGEMPYDPSTRRCVRGLVLFMVWQGALSLCGVCIKVVMMHVSCLIHVSRCVAICCGCGQRAGFT